jgi:hypothetical protein
VLVDNRAARRDFLSQGPQSDHGEEFLTWRMKSSKFLAKGATTYCNATASGKTRRGMKSTLTKRQ